MRRYYVGFAVVVVLSQTVGIGFALAFGLKGAQHGIPADRALWQDLLALALTLLTALALGEWLSRDGHITVLPWKWTLPTVLVMVVLALVTAQRNDFRMILPGGLAERVLNHLFREMDHRQGNFAPVGQALLAVLYHVGWRWGRADRAVM